MLVEQPLPASSLNRNNRNNASRPISLLAMLLAVVTKGDAYLFSPPRRVQWLGSLAEQPRLAR